jgi:hypothetical protein
MAGDWIKMQKDTPDKPEVLAIASRLGIDPDAAVGKLVRIWSWFDTHTTDGNASCVTYAFLDRLAGVTGFAEQMSLVGWLVEKGHSLSLPNFDYHTGETAKKRAMGQKRQEKHRSNANSNASSVTNASPEKRREEKSISVTDVTGASAPTARDLVFSNGVPLLTIAGVSEKNARSMLAGLCKANGDEAVARAIDDCAKANPVQPVSWLQAVLRGGGPLGIANKQTALETRNRAAAEAWLQQEGLPQ